MKKFALTAIAALVLSAPVAANVLNERPAPNANSYITEDGKTLTNMGNGVIMVQTQNADGSIDSVYRVLQADLDFRDTDGYIHTIKGAGDKFEEVRDGLDAAMNGRPNGEDSQGRPFPGQGDRPTPGTGEGSVERPMPGTGEGSVERPQPGNGAGSVERPQPGQGERPYPGTGEGSVERPQPGQNNRPGNDTSTRPGLVNQVNQNKNNIAAMGEAFEQRVDVVNGYLSQAGQAIQNNSNKVDALSNAFQAQAAHTTQEIARLDGRINSLEEKTEKLKGGIASATAIASLNQYTGNGTHHVAVGIGGYDGAAAMAAGYTYAISADTTIRATFAFDTEGDVAMGASIGHSW